jgi:hypothetical protein
MELIERTLKIRIIADPRSNLYEIARFISHVVTVFRDVAEIGISTRRRYADEYRRESNRGAER